MNEITILRLPHDHVPIANATIHNGLVYVSGAVGFGPGTMLPIAADIRAQSREVFRLLDETLKQAGSASNRLLKVQVHLADIRRDFSVMNEEFACWVGDHRPARTTVEAKLAIDGLLIEVDCIAVC